LRLDSSRLSWARIGALLTTATLGATTTATAEPVAFPDNDRVMHDVNGLAADIAQSIAPWDAPSRLLDRVYASLQDGGAHASAATYPFAIPAGPLAGAIDAFRTITGLAIQVGGDLLQGMTTDGVNGSLTSAQALDRLLAGSGLSYRFVQPNVVAIEI